MRLVATPTPLLVLLLLIPAVRTFTPEPISCGFRQQSSFHTTTHDDADTADNTPSPIIPQWTHNICGHGQIGRPCSEQLKREEHRVGPLPWEKDQVPIEESYAGHIPIRTWTQDGHHGETSFWLQGGPGSSSMIGLFFENGPIYVTENMTLARRPISWADEYSVLFIDQPVGTGFSFVTNVDDTAGTLLTNEDTQQNVAKSLEDELQADQAAEEDLFEKLGDNTLSFKMLANQKRVKKDSSRYSHGYCKDQRAVATDLIRFLTQFFDRYPEQQQVDLFLTGESYAGKYVPAFAHAIVEHNARQAPGQNIFRLKGIALGNSLTDPISQVQIHADHAYFLGLVTRKQAEQMRVLQQHAVEEAEHGRFLASGEYRRTVLDVFKNVTGSVNWYDIRKGSVPNDWSRMEAFLNLAPIKDSLNIYGPRSSFLKENNVPQDEMDRIETGRNQTRFFKDPLVFKFMAGDVMKSTAWMVGDLLESGVRVLAYQGVFDFRDGVAGSTAWIEDLEWSGKTEFQEAERELWKVDDHLAGYVTSVGALTRVTILGAGHLAPMDQAKAALAMIRGLVEGSALDTQVPASASKASHIM
ncbi:hypothetical protein BGZ94_008452 [Podila epigama]|nr:hypothetical protein BGZ94_008452 [Podila epigama]